MRTSKNVLASVSLVFLTSITVLATLPIAHADEITIDISRAVYPGFFDKIDVAFQKESGISIRYIEDPKVAADMSVILQNVIDGKTEVGIGPIAIKDWISLMEKEKKPVAKPDELTSRVISKDLVAFIANSGAGVKGIKLDQLADIFSGKTKNWREVGGKDLPIVVVLPKVAHTKAFVKNQLLKGHEFAAKAEETESAPETLKKVAVTAGAVSWAPMNQVVGESKNLLLKSEDFGRPVTFVTKGKPSDKVFKLIKFINDQKQ
jgi:phosphate transport system substrate-binding protein